MWRTLLVLVAMVGLVYADDRKPAAPIDARIIKADVQGARTLYTTDKGFDAGVDKDWTAELTSGGKPIAKATLIRIDKPSSVVMSSQTFDQLPPDLGVRFSPPAAPAKK